MICDEFLGEPPPSFEIADRGAGPGGHRDHSPLIVENDEWFVTARGERSGESLVHHSFTMCLPFTYPVATDNESTMPKVLIVEDDEVIAQGMARHLGAAGFDPVSVGNGTQGLARLRYEKADVCVLDLMLPGVDGWKLIEMARNEGIGTPIVVVSARGTEHDRVHALEIGADDYLVKPFSMKELVARVQAAARRGVRAQEPARGEPIEIEELRIDPDQVEAYVDGDAAGLTPTEFRLLYALALERGRVVTRDELLQRVWGRRETHRDRTVDVFVRKMREKIDRRAPRHTFIQTRYGVGYKLDAVPK
jgi:DNA-binding response OmpR family regulator